jgi:alkylation response protein AidB-like acyl-CoA dehydrogenase
VDYKVDVRDVKFQLFEWLPTKELLEQERFADWDAENVEMVIDEALKIAQEQMAPCNEDGDRIGAQWNDGVVTMPPSFHPVFNTVAEGGWIGLLANPEYGGMGLPEVVGTVVNEYFSGANVSLSLTLMLTRGAGAMIEHFGTEEQKGRYIEKLYMGQWGGTMCLTEPQAGSDVGASTTKAIKNDDGSYQITGEKIFITSGDQDLTENVIHLVLARTPDAPGGTKGLSLFIVPKIWVNEDGSLGDSNDVYCNNIEEKMGIHGSPTCSLVFGGKDGCRGYLLGEECQGMKLMFHMMNAARIEVGLQGCAAAGAAHQQALAYAKERLQSRHWKEMKNPDAPQVAIVEHPDVRRALLTSKGYTEAMRALLLQTSYYHDLSMTLEGEEAEKYKAYVEILTPICKAWCSEWGVQVAHWCLQVHGGYGYTQRLPRRAVHARRRDRLHLRGHQRHPGPRLRRPQAAHEGRRAHPRAPRQLAEATFNTAKSDRRAHGARVAARRRTQADRDHLQGAHQAPRRHPSGAPQCAAHAARHGRHDCLGAHLPPRPGASWPRPSSPPSSRSRASAPTTRRPTRSSSPGHAEAAFFHNKVQTAIHFAYRALPTVAAKAAAIRSGEKAAALRDHVVGTHFDSSPPLTRGLFRVPSPCPCPMGRLGGRSSTA